jgi:DNA-binding transcriptional ArsR family regulator
MLDPDFLSAIGHPLRLRVLVRLERAPATVRVLAEETGLPRDEVAEHVRQLANAGLVEEAGVAGDEPLWRARATGWAELETLLVAAAGAPDAAR